MKQINRALTAMLLTLMLTLSGCLGSSDDTESEGNDGGLIPTAQGSTTTTVVNGNYLPMVHAAQIGDTEADISWDWENETTTTTTTAADGTTTNTTEVTSSYFNGTLLGMNVTLYHAAFDPEGTNMAMGWDLNLDGTIDIPVSTNSGYTTVNIPLNQWHDVPHSELKIITVAFIASDTPGDLGVSMLEVYSVTPVGPWSEYRGGISAFSFGGNDTNGTPGTGDSDDLIRLTMIQGGDINWASLSVKISVDGAAPMTCDNPGVEGTAVCSLVEFGNTDDQVWSVGDGVTIMESGQDMCSGDCLIDVTITDTRAGMIIGTVTSIPAE